MPGVITPVKALIVKPKGLAPKLAFLKGPPVNGVTIGVLDDAVLVQYELLV